MKEEWRTCEDDLGLEVSSKGRVRRIGETWCLGSRRQQGVYVAISCVVDGERTTIPAHVLVAKAFIGPPTDERPHINHINSVTYDNRPENLEWVSPSENARHGQFNKNRPLEERIKNPVSAFMIPPMAKEFREPKEPKPYQAKSPSGGPVFAVTPALREATKRKEICDRLSFGQLWNWRSGYFPVAIQLLLACPGAAAALAKDARNLTAEQRAAILESLPLKT